MVVRSVSDKSAASRIFRGLARSYDGVADYATLLQDRYWKRWATDRIDPRKDGLVLDVGCGTLLLEARARAEGREFVGLDLSGEMLKGGVRKRLSNVRLMVQGDAESLPFRDCSFDTVVSCYVPKYVAVDVFAAELARVAKAGGSAVVYDFARPKGSFSLLLDLYIQGGLRVVGHMLGILGREEAITFNELPKIIMRTEWDARIVGAMESEGFRCVDAERLTGGAVFAYFGVKPGGLR